MEQPDRSTDIQRTMQRIVELENQIAKLKEDAAYQQSLDFLKELTKLMEHSKLGIDEVVELLVRRGNLDSRWFSCETVYRMRHIFGLAEVFASHGVDRPSWLPSR